MRFNLFYPLVLVASSMLQAGDLPPAVLAKFVRILELNAGSTGKVVCKDATIAVELAKIGVTTDPDAKLLWATSDAEVKAGKAAKKLVICGKLEQLPKGGSIAVIEEGGKPQIYLHMNNISESGVTLAHNVLTIGKRM